MMSEPIMSAGDSTFRMEQDYEEFRTDRQQRARALLGRGLSHFGMGRHGWLLV